MKIKFLIPITFLFLCFGCSVDSNDNTQDFKQETAQVFQWHLINVSGGLVGVDIDYDMDTIIWVFDVDSVGSGSIEIQNNNTDDTLEDAFDTGVYSVSIPVYDTQSILFVNGDEFAGVLTPTDDDLVLNTNITSRGNIGSDGFVYTFKRKVIIVN